MSRPPAAEPITQPRLGAIGWLRWAWRQLTSMRTALLLLLLLAIAAVPGSVLPQRRINPTQVQGYLAEHRSIGPWLDRVGGFDVYASPWFSAIYLLLFVSLVGCVVPRSRLHLAAIRARPPRTPSRLDRMPAYLRVTSELDQAQALAAARAQLRARRYRVAEHDQGTSLAGEKGQLAETGNLAFHLSLLGVLVAVAAGSLFGYSGQAIVVVGGKDFANVLPRYSSFHGGTRVDDGDLPPFSLGLDDLRVRFEEQAVGFGAPRDFRADVRVQPEPGAAVHREVLKVNRPLDVGGARIFLVGNGYAVRVTVTDGTGAVAFAGAVPLIVQDGNYTSAGAIKVPDARPGQLGFRALLLPTAAAGDDGLPVSIFPDAKNPRLLVTAYTGDLGLDTGAPSSVYALDTKDLTQLENGSRPLRAILAPGERMSLPDGLGTLDFEGVTRYAALDIRHDPSKGWALGSALLALAGLVGSLFVRRRRVWVRVLPAGPGGQTGSVLEVAGLARGEDPRLMAEIGALAAAVDPAAAPQAADGENDDSRGESVRASAGTGKE